MKNISKTSKMKYNKIIGGLNSYDSLQFNKVRHNFELKFIFNKYSSDKLSLN